MNAAKKEARGPGKKLGAIKAREVLDVSASMWSSRPWEARREQSPDEQPFCDIAASQALARLAEMGQAMPSAQKFLIKDGLSAWQGTFAWGTSWCASREDVFWAWAQGEGPHDKRVEIAGPVKLWDEDVLEEFAVGLSGTGSAMGNA